MANQNQGAKPAGPGTKRTASTSPGMNEHNRREHEAKVKRDGERDRGQGAENEHNRREHEEAERRKG